MPVRQLCDFLDKENVKYVTIRHSPAYTTSEIAASAHVPGKEVAKTVIVKLDGKMAMAVVPSSFRLDLEQFKGLTGASSVELATEDEFRELFAGCELGAMPPFGNLYGMEVFASPELSRHERIAFNAGTHAELIQIPYADFEHLVKPKVLDFAFSN